MINKLNNFLILSSNSSHELELNSIEDDTQELSQPTKNNTIKYVLIVGVVGGVAVFGISNFFLSKSRHIPLNPNGENDSKKKDSKKKDSKKKDSKRKDSQEIDFQEIDFNKNDSKKKDLKKKESKCSQCKDKMIDNFLTIEKLDNHNKFCPQCKNNHKIYIMCLILSSDNQKQIKRQIMGSDEIDKTEIKKLKQLREIFDKYNLTSFRKNLKPNSTSYLSLINYKYNNSDTLYASIEKIYKMIKMTNNQNFKKLYTKIMNNDNYIWNDRLSNSKQTKNRNDYNTFISGIKFLIDMLWELEGKKENLKQIEGKKENLKQNKDPQTVNDILNHKCNKECKSECIIKTMQTGIQSMTGQTAEERILKNPKTTIEEIITFTVKTMKQGFADNDDALKKIKEITDSNLSPWEKLIKLNNE